MFLHITYNNGSNPLVYRGDETFIKKRLRELQRNYYILNLEETNRIGGGYFVFVENKIEAAERELRELLFKDAKINRLPLF